MIGSLFIIINKIILCYFSFNYAPTLPLCTNLRFDFFSFNLLIEVQFVAMDKNFSKRIMIVLTSEFVFLNPKNKNIKFLKKGLNFKYKNIGTGSMFLISAL